MATIRFVCPPDVQKGSAEVLSGVYEPGENVKAKIILDIGGNVGAFSCWANERFPGCEIHCYEPSPSNLTYLLKNTAHLTNLNLHHVAVTSNFTPTVKLYKSYTNCGAQSIYDVGEQTEEFEEVDTLHPNLLPRADFIKIDTEGCELEIFANYLHYDTLSTVAYEWHRNSDKWKLGAMFVELGFELVKEIQYNTAHRGVCVWVKKVGE